MAGSGLASSLVWVSVQHADVRRRFWALGHQLPSSLPGAQNLREKTTTGHQSARWLSVSRGTGHVLPLSSPSQRRGWPGSLRELVSRAQRLWPEPAAAGRPVVGRGWWSGDPWRQRLPGAAQRRQQPVWQSWGLSSQVQARAASQRSADAVWLVPLVVVVEGLALAQRSGADVAQRSASTTSSQDCARKDWSSHPLRGCSGRRTGD